MRTTFRYPPGLPDSVFPEGTKNQSGKFWDAIIAQGCGNFILRIPEIDHEKRRKSAH